MWRVVKRISLAPCQLQELWREGKKRYALRNASRDSTDAVRVGMLKAGSDADACPPASRSWTPVWWPSSAHHALRPNARTLPGRVLPGGWVHLLPGQSRDRTPFRSSQRPRGWVGPKNAVPQSASPLSKQVEGQKPPHPPSYIFVVHFT